MPNVFLKAAAAEHWHPHVVLLFLFLIKDDVMTPHLNRLIETVQMRGHNIRLYAELTKIITKCSLLSRALHDDLLY